ncbi:sensor histidine kinase [Oceanicaulis alexandrii]|uniref:sensor histidine kinase n=3 Tax=Oceanicaulis TaxID=153232 RepID=UPI0003B40F0B|nr:HAMP domain-containing sensor histidine kinase [Oceanicaulis alexandrii]
MQSLHGFMPHGMCYLWRLDILIMHVMADVLIGLSYLSIPVVIWWISVKRPDILFRPVAYLFILFIILCGVTHLFSIYTVWTPAYFIEGGLKLATAIVSVATAVVLWPLLPKALAMPSSEQLAQSNKSLQDEVLLRTGAERQLKQLTNSLERQVQRRTSELERSNGTLRDFAAGASHDLKAPARQISLLADLAQRELDDTANEKAVGYLKDVKSKSRDMLVLIDTLLSYSDLVETKAAANATAIKPMLEALLHDYYPEAPISLRIEGEPLVQGDETLLAHLFRNLIDNAVKYADTPQVILTVDSHDSAQGLVIRFADNGPGIPETQRTGVFKMMQRYRSDVPGSGVGLAFCARIMEAHDGTILVDPDYEDGARFILTFPVIKELSDDEPDH